MSLKQKFVSVFASGLILGSLALVASAQDQAPAAGDGMQKAEKHGRSGFGRRGGPGRGIRSSEFRGMPVLRGVELTEAQKAQVKQIREASRPDQATMDELKAIHEARRAGTLSEGQKSRAQILADQMRLRNESVQQQVLAVLTPEQRQQIEVRKAERQKKMEERRQLRQQKRQSAPPAANRSTDI